MTSSSVDVVRQVPSLAIVVPRYNEEEVLQQSAPALLDKLEALRGKGLASSESRVIFVDDGSEDHTWDIIRTLHEERDHAEGIRLISVLVAIVMLIYTIVSVTMEHAVAGWGSTMVSIWLVGGLLMISMGVTGGHVDKVYLEVKHRPRYLAEEELI